MKLSEFFALTGYMTDQTPLYGQVGTDKNEIVPLSQLAFLQPTGDVALVAGSKPLTLNQAQTRLSQVSQNRKLFCQVDQGPAQPLLGFHQDDQGRLILQ
ncbi:hypothetical protein [Fructobacillus ficulneus]|uniref:Uncharacterized protein n=1 Tax=Fructobacillus ficulneus TaxID=157463 RepID=A0A0K8MIA6_9LACO|nr:hypothetical protein [Fructobacillus ficulneus]GAP00188.1 hypothetical protein FFIC_281980 [Fructobacillus ficulneus]